MEFVFIYYNTILKKQISVEVANGYNIDTAFNNIFKHKYMLAIRDFDMEYHVVFAEVIDPNTGEMLRAEHL